MANIFIYTKLPCHKFKWVHWWNLIPKRQQLQLIPVSVYLCTSLLLFNKAAARGRMVLDNTVYMVTSKYHKLYREKKPVVHVSPPKLGKYMNDKPATYTRLSWVQQVCIYFSYFYHFTSNVHHKFCIFCLCVTTPQNNYISRKYQFLVLSCYTPEEDGR